MVSVRNCCTWGRTIRLHMAENTVNELSILNSAKFTQNARLTARTLYQSGAFAIQAVICFNLPSSQNAHGWRTMALFHELAFAFQFTLRFSLLDKLLLGLLKPTELTTLIIHILAGFYIVWKTAHKDEQSYDLLEFQLGAHLNICENNETVPWVVYSFRSCSVTACFHDHA